LPTQILCNCAIVHDEIKEGKGRKKEGRKEREREDTKKKNWEEEKRTIIILHDICGWYCLALVTAFGIAYLRFVACRNSSHSYFRRIAVS